MPNPVQEAADRELGRAISAEEQANTHYHQILRRFISDKPSSEIKPRQPEARLDAGALKEISSAWEILNSTEKKLRNAYMKLYAAYL